MRLKQRVTAPWLMAGRLSAAIMLSTVLGEGCAQREVEVPCPRPEPIMGLNLGGGLASYIISSHLQTGWARYLETVPATTLLNGIGNWSAANQLRRPEDADRVLGALRERGIRLFRREVGWANTVYREDLGQPMRLTDGMDALYRAILQASKRHDFRVIVLLNSHQGLPCATLKTTARFARDGKQGDTEVLLEIDDPSVVRPGYTGISDLTANCAAEGLFKEVQPRPQFGAKAFGVTISKPLPKDYRRGTEVPVRTLQYRPFGDPRTDEETYRGWSEYADLLARIAVEEGLSDGDVHFEVWNELTFGSWFLYAGKYDARIEGQADRDRLLGLAATAVRRYFPVKSMVINGFSNSSFFRKGFWMAPKPAGVDAESYHPYGIYWRDFPQHAAEGPAQLREVFKNVDGFVPRYGTLFPEYRGNYTTSHDIIALMQPEMRELLVERGQAPPGWKRGLSENSIFLDGHKAPEPYAGRAQERPEHYVGKFWLRLYPFYLNKGLHFICDGSLCNPDDVKDSWEKHFIETGEPSHLSPLAPLQRLVGIFEGAQDLPRERLMRLRPRVWQLSGHEKTIFDAEGATILTTIPLSERERTWDPSKVRPQPLYYRDVFCLLPFQIDDTTLAVGAYIQTRNFLVDVPDAGRYRIAFPGLKTNIETVRVYDPLEDREVPAEVGETDGAPSLTVTLTDYPIWIVLRDVDGERGGGPVVANAPRPWWGP